MVKDGVESNTSTRETELKADLFTLHSVLKLIKIKSKIRGK